MILLVVETEGKRSAILNSLRKMSLNNDVHVVSTNGHYMDLPKSSIGFGRKDFSPSWKITNPYTFSLLKKAVETSSEVVSFFDFSPEGELLSQHLQHTASNSGKTFRRIRPSSLDLTNLSASLESSGDCIDTNLSNSFLAREAVDRIARFVLSPRISSILGRDVELSYFIPVLSAVARRERSIRKFSPDKAYEVRALLSDGSYSSWVFASENEAEDFAQKLKSSSVVYSSNKKASVVPGLFSLSSLLSFCFSRYGIDARSCIEICTSLYSRGLTSYPMVSGNEMPLAAANRVRDFISERMMGAHLSASPSFVGNSFGIYPTDFYFEPSKTDLRSKERDVYSAIWFRTAGSQGTNSLIECHSASFYNSSDLMGSIQGTSVHTPGWHQLSGRIFEPSHSPIESDSVLADVSVVEVTSRSPVRMHYNSIIEWMTNHFFGFPHTYTKALNWMSNNSYVEFGGGGVATLTPKGEVVLTAVRRALPDLLDPDMAAQVEEDVGRVAEGRPINEFVSEYWEWSDTLLSSSRVKNLRPSFLSPSGSKMKVILSSKGKPYAEDNSGWTCYVRFDEKGRIVQEQPTSLASQ